MADRTSLDLVDYLATHPDTLFSVDVSFDDGTTVYGDVRGGRNLQRRYSAVMVAVSHPESAILVDRESGEFVHVGYLRFGDAVRRLCATHQVDADTAAATLALKGFSSANPATSDPATGDPLLGLFS